MADDQQDMFGYTERELALLKQAQQITNWDAMEDLFPWELPFHLQGIGREKNATG